MPLQLHLPRTKTKNIYLVSKALSAVFLSQRKVCKCRVFVADLWLFSTRRISSREATFFFCFMGCQLKLMRNLFNLYKEISICEIKFALWKAGFSRRMSSEIGTLSHVLNLHL